VSEHHRATSTPMNVKTLIAITVPVAIAYTVPWGDVTPWWRFTLLGAAAIVGVILVSISLPYAIYYLFLWSGLVNIEPAPFDAIWAALVPLTLLLPRLRGQAHFKRKFPDWDAHGRQEKLRLLVVVLVVLFGVIGLVSIPSCNDVVRAAYYHGITVYLLAVSVWVGGFLQSRKVLAAAIWGWMGASVIVAALGSLSIGLNVPFLSRLLYGGIRAQVTFKDPNVFGSFLAFGALLAAFRFLTYGEDADRAPYLRSGFLFAILLEGILASGSRGTCLSVLVGGLVSLALLARAQRIAPLVKRIGLLLLFTIPAIAYEILSGHIHFLLGRVGLQEYDLLSRFPKQAEGLKAIGAVKSFFVGMGPGSYEAHLGLAAHNTYLRLAFETGLLSAILFITICILVAVILARLSERHSTPLALALLGSIVFSLVYGFFIDTLHWRHLWVTIGVALALAPYGTAPLADYRSKQHQPNGVSQTREG